MSWQPGQRVVTDEDQREWARWRRESKRDAQRARRARYPRIDYYPDDAANELIRSMAGRCVGGDFSSVINRIVGEWAEQCHRNNQRRGKDDAGAPGGQDLDCNEQSEAIDRRGSATVTPEYFAEK